MNNIEVVKDFDVCCGCGTCSAACPHHAISYEYTQGQFLPCVDKEKCVDCGICGNVCPSHKVDVIKAFPSLDFNKDEIECYTAFSKNEAIRRISTSGGVITTMVEYLLKTKRYDKAYLLHYDAFDGSKALVKAVADANEVKCYAKSKYIPASVELLASDIKNDRIGKSIIVATPCQLLAIKRLFALYKKQDEDVLFLGLFCDMVFNYEIYKYFEDKYGVFDSLHFRDKELSGWPGNVLIKQGEKKVDVPRTERIKVKEKFKLNRCNYCFDKLNMLADISFGDCYLSGEEDVKGKSNVIVRTIKGKNVWRDVEFLFEMTVATFSSIKRSQGLDAKRLNLFRNIFDDKAVFQNVPFEYGVARRSVKQNANGIVKKTINLFTAPRNIYRILIDRVGFKNKGAQLMLMAIVNQIKLFRPEAVIVVRQSVYDENPSYCYANGIIPLMEKKTWYSKLAYKFAHNFLLRDLGCALPSQIDLILDAAGFCCSDQFVDMYSAENQKREKQYYDSFTKKNRQIILLPQAMGPLEKQETKSVLHYFVHYATKIYLRDNVSYEYVKRETGENNKITKGFDFTCLVHAPNKTIVNLPPKSYVAIIVNSRMLTHGRSAGSNNYKQFMLDIITFFIKKKESVILLNHAGEDDEQMMYELNRLLPNPVPIYSNLDALCVKSIINNCKLLVSSRFHGVVSGLVQRVPTFCTSWSHKYEELLGFFGCENNLLDENEEILAFEKLEAALKDPSIFVAKEGSIETIESQTRDMWLEIFNR